MKGLLQASFERFSGFFLETGLFLKNKGLEASWLVNGNRLRSISNYKMEIFYQKNHTCQLGTLCDFYGTDKGQVRQGSTPNLSHTYSDFYASLYSHCRRGVLSVFECGIGTTDPQIPSTMGPNGSPGASLRVWRDYFPNAEIFGADIDRNVLFAENRITTFHVNQLDPSSISNMWQQIPVDGFDLMIDDGLHTFEGGTTLFLHSIYKLASHGIYVIEDVYPSDLVRYAEFFHGTNYYVEFVCLYRPSVSLSNNSLVVIRKQQGGTHV